MEALLAQSLQTNQPLLEELWAELRSILIQEQLPTLSCLESPPHHSELRWDGYDQSHALFMEWRSASGGYLGNLVVHGNGQSYAEFDVLVPHPRQSQWFVEAVTVWGVQGALKSELRLLPALGE